MARVVIIDVDEEEWEGEQGGGRRMPAAVGLFDLMRYVYVWRGDDEIVKRFVEPKCCLLCDDVIYPANARPHGKLLTARMTTCFWCWSRLRDRLWDHLLAELGPLPAQRTWDFLYPSSLPGGGTGADTLIVEDREERRRLDRLNRRWAGFWDGLAAPCLPAAVAAREESCR
jgi:hypothetical protein